jgi:nitroimidazol reductase NimA-like FMN-containing flavoprotein (pyridoxamine 5'-phosphate oxidase superfamily)
MVRELTALEAREMLTREKSARLCFSKAGRPSVVNVTYRADDWRELHLDRSLGQSSDLSRSGALVCVEVDRFHGPERWETVVGYGELVGAPGSGVSEGYRLQLSRLRGFGCTPERRLMS